MKDQITVLLLVFFIILFWLPVFISSKNSWYSKYNGEKICLKTWPCQWM